MASDPRIATTSLAIVTRRSDGYHVNVISMEMLRLKSFGGLRVEKSGDEVALAVRAKGLALLAVIAAGGPDGVSRERVLGILWPESSTDRARHALSQTIYNLKGELDAEPLVGSPEMRLNSEVITTDVGEFLAAVKKKDWQAASALYEGPFLDGFYLAEAEGFERWAEEKRSDFGVDAIRSVNMVARDHQMAGRMSEALNERRRLTRLDPLSGIYATAYMELLVLMGDTPGALAHARVYSDLLRRDLDAEPDASFQRAVSQIRAAAPVVGPMITAPLVSPDNREHDATALHSTEPLPVRQHAFDPHVNATPPRAGAASLTKFYGSKLTLALGITAGLAAVGLSLWIGLGRQRRPVTAPVIAVGKIRDMVTPDSARLGGVLGEVLTTSLGRVSQLRVVASSRILELTPRDADTVRSALTEAARRAGATEILEGELIPLERGKIRLDIRRVDLTGGRVLGGYGIIGADRMSLLDSVTSLLAADLRLASPVQTLTSVSTASPLAYRYYEDGIRAFYQYDAFAAGRLFRLAVREDSTFPMAAYYRWQAAVLTADTAQSKLAERALRLANNASERDRLLIVTHIAGRRFEMRASAAAESLATRYPSDPEALLRAAYVFADLSRAVRLLNKSIAIDSTAGVSGGPVCRLCEALSQLYDRYDWADSTGAAEKTVRRWIKLRPDDPSAWSALANHMITVGRVAEATAAMKRSQDLGGVRLSAPERRLTWSLRTDDVEGAVSQCSSLLLTPDLEEFSTFRWYCLIALRMGGRLGDARQLLVSGRIPGSSVVRRRVPAGVTEEAILDQESGRSLRAAKEFESLGYFYRDTSASTAALRARNGTWHMTLAATALALGGDTASARGLVDSIRVIGSRSRYARDPVLFHFVRGLLLSRAGEQQAAIVEFRAAMSSPNNGYTRINYELGKSLIAIGQAGEAIPVLRAPLHGGVDGSGLYLTRTETHEMLAQAFERAGQLDSARVHYRIVARAWSHADPQFLSRFRHAKSVAQ